jgi:steroid delta-isomerase-like uncharacterized protein
MSMQEGHAVRRRSTMGSLTDLARDSVDAFNNRDWERMTSLLAPNCLYDEVSTGRRARGHAEILDSMKGWTSAFRDVGGTVTSTMERGDTVVLEITWRGTHDGPLDGPSGSIPPSRKPVTIRAVQIFGCEGNRILEVRHYFDQYDMLRQIGAIPTEKARRAGA